MTSPLLLAQSTRQIVNQPISWAGYTANIKTGKNTSLFVDAQFRYAGSPAPERAYETMQYLFRSHLDFKLTPQLSVAPMGAVMVLNFKYGKQPVSIPNDELRLYQQIMFHHTLGKFSLNHRLRTEERFIEVHDPVTGESTGYTNFQFRPRYRFMATLPLNKPAEGAAAFNAQMFYEGFISRGKKVTFHDIDQNRLFAGITCKPGKSLTFGLGWFYQMLIKSNGAKQENNVGTLLTITHNFSLVN
ncbi:MAG: DUF2490 domain-containing protein [Bacteroidota bacterium]